MSEPFYGDIKRMPDRLLGEKLEESKQAVTDYSRELQRRKNFTSAERLADRLHALLHGAKGIDCDYHYSDWGTGQLTQCRHEFKLMAESLMTWVEGSSYKAKEKALGRMLTILEKR